MTVPFQTIDEAYEQVAERAGGQIAALLDAFQEIEEPSDDAPESLQGITKDRDGRAMLVFQSPDTPRQRSIVYVDAILDLANLLRRERVIDDDLENLDENIRLLAMKDEDWNS